MKSLLENMVGLNLICERDVLCLTVDGYKL